MWLYSPNQSRVPITEVFVGLIWVMFMSLFAFFFGKAKIVVYEHSVTWTTQLGGITDCPFSQLAVSEEDRPRGLFLVLAKADEDRREFRVCDLENGDELVSVLKAKAGQRD